MKANLPNMIASQMAGFADEAITVTATAKKLTPATFEDSDGIAKRAVITIESGGQIRYRYNGSDPTSSVGHLMTPFGVIILNTTTSIKNFRIAASYRVFILVADAILLKKPGL